MRQIAHITDIHLEEPFPIEHGVDARRNWSLILEDITSKNINEIIFGGDIGKKESNQWFFDSLRDFKVHAILGNHDFFREVIKYYESDSSGQDEELFYSHEDSFIKYIFLDSSSGELSQGQFNWLKNEVKTDKKILLLIHHPVLEVETPMDQLYPLKRRKEVKALLHASKQEVLVMCGHYHTVDERSERNIRQLLTPAGSYQIRKNANAIEVINDMFGYRIINIHNDEIKTSLRLYEDGRFVSEE